MAETLKCSKCKEIMEKKGDITEPYSVDGDEMEDTQTFFQCPKCKNIEITEWGFKYDNDKII